MFESSEQCTHSERGKKPIRSLLLQKHRCSECGGWIRPRPETVTIAFAAALVTSLPVGRSDLLAAYSVPSWLGTIAAYLFIYLATMALLLPTSPWRHVSTSAQLEHRYRILILFLVAVGLMLLISWRFRGW
jgi:hypothetical protein